MDMTRAPNILIVDDEPAIRECLQEMLKPDGYVTDTVANGPQALVSVANQRPDLILLDVMMPGMDGFEVATTLKSNPDTAGIPIIMVTASSGRGARVVGLNTGAEDFLTKPVDATELSLKVRNLLRLSAISHSAGYSASP
jgi:DNA-binding response OmpR family regulator